MPSQLSFLQSQLAPATDQYPFMNISLEPMAPLTDQGLREVSFFIGRGAFENFSSFVNF